jgi:hypothetical protein
MKITASDSDAWRKLLRPRKKANCCLLGRTSEEVLDRLHRQRVLDESGSKVFNDGEPPTIT